jgi:hypothetical protein
MSTSANRRYKRAQARLQNKINEQFFKRIKGKTPQEIDDIMEQIRIKYNIPQREDVIEIQKPIDIDELRS